MKYCPECQKNYPEVWLTFCTEDGTLLREELSPPADPNWDPRIRGPQYADPSEQATQWLPRDTPAAGGWVAPDERAPITGPWQPPPPPLARPNVKPPQAGMAVASFALGLCSLMMSLFCLPPVLGILAIIFGFAALSKLKNTPELTGRGFAIAGIAMGGIHVAIFILWLLWLVLAIAFG